MNPSLPQIPRSYAGSFLAPCELEELVQNPEAALSGEFLQYALAKGDKCYGFVQDGALKAYCWYATTPTRMSPHFRIHFKRDYIYLHKGFTHERHRGQRLFPLGMTQALKHYRAVGYKGMLLYVSPTNIDSLKACAGMGFRVSGSVYIVRLLGRYFIYSTPGCKRFGFRVEVVSDAAELNKITALLQQVR